ncbi:7 transmembrane receptor [Ancylostoma ceylanicum]|uniref:7 transmembrane receptor n=2 Tax=Ancylostoma ceylanicum TaxID=53326 RepID=A0A0D6LRY1_9BILA|nr:7 transmembrane receptor [Ancylostoma ceylanicum]EYC19770.1 hypothetical protein Y032_0023g706 [Ancylostoma ceylanicum]
MTDCVPFTDDFKDPSMEPPIVIGFSVLYSVEFLFGLTGNIGVILFTSRNKKLQTVQNMFILNLALADLIVCIFSLPITPITSIYKNWYFGEQMCHSLPWIQGASVFVATFSLTLIAIDRYFMVVTPHKRRMTRVQARFVMVCLWLVAILITFPYSWYMQLREPEGGYCGKFCTEEWPNEWVRRAYTVFVLIAQFFVPFMIMFYCYARIFKHLKQRTQDKIRKMNERSLILTASMPVLSTVKRKVGTRVDVLEQCRRKCLLLQQTRRNTVVLVLVVLFFFVSWFPHNVASMAFEFSDAEIFSYDGTNYMYLISLISHSVAMISIMSNPVLYGLLNRGFVSHLRHGWTSSLRKFKKSETDVSAVLV